MRGVIERLVPAEGFGVPRGEDGGEYFVHENAMSGDEFSELAEGFYIDFPVSPRHDGDRRDELPRASHIRLAPGQYPGVDNSAAPPGKVD